MNITSLTDKIDLGTTGSIFSTILDWLRIIFAFVKDLVDKLPSPWNDFILLGIVFYIGWKIGRWRGLTPIKVMILFAILFYLVIRFA